MAENKRRNLIKGAAFLASGLFVFFTRDTWIGVGVVLLISSAFALLMAPVCTKLEHLGIKPALSALCCVGLLALSMIMFLLIFVPYLFTHTMGLIRRMTPTVSLVFENAQRWFLQWGMEFAPSMNMPQLITAALAPLTTGLAKGGIAVISLVGNTAIALVIAYYFLTVRYKAGCHLLLMIPTRKRKVFLAALMGCRNAALGYLSGLIKTSTFVGCATFFGLMVLGIKDSLILALFMGMLEILPYIGPLLGAIPILISAVPMGWAAMLSALLLVLLIQQIESSIIGPYFTASSTSIHPLTAIIGVFIGGKLFGFAGILLTVPALVVLRSIVWSLGSTSIQFDS